MGFPFRPQLSAAAELFVVNLVAQHNPQPDPQFAGCLDPRLAHSFVDELAPIEAFQLFKTACIAASVHRERSSALPSLLSFPNCCRFPLLCSPGIIPI